MENLKLALSVGNNISELCAVDNSKSQRDRFYPRLRAEIFSIIFATLNIDINSGAGVYTEAEAKKLLKILHMKSNDFNQLSDQIQVAKSWVNPSHAVRSVNRILRHFFMFDIQSREYRVNGVRNSKYMICTAKLAVMQKLVRNI